MDSGVERVGQRDEQLLAAGERIIRSLGDITALSALSSETGLSVYPAMACKASEIDLSRMRAQRDAEIFFMHPCFDEGLGDKSVTSWTRYFTTLQKSLALSQTERIVLNQRYGVGIDTGTSYLVEQRFVGSDHKLISYLYLGSEAEDYRDWEEIGLMFVLSGGEMKLVAIYRDHFFHV